MKAVAGRLRLDLAQYRELAAFASSAPTSTRRRRRSWRAAERMTEILKQDQYQPLPVEKQVVIIFAGDERLPRRARRWPTAARYEKELVRLARARPRRRCCARSRRRRTSRASCTRASSRPRSTEFAARLRAEREGLAGAERSMPALIDIRRRIRSVKSTQQITKAMKMVSAAKLRRAQEAMFAARPYARKMMEVLELRSPRAPRATRTRCSSSATARRTLLVVITADKGLCGGVQRQHRPRGAAASWPSDSTARVELALVGRKGRDFFRRREVRIRSEQRGRLLGRCATRRRAALAARARWTPSPRHEVDEVYLVYNEFKSVIQQRLVVERLLPIERHALRPQEPAMDYIYEPDAAGDLRRAAAQARRGAGLAGAARVGGGRARRAHDGDGRGHEQRERDDRPPDAVHEQGAPGRDHQGDHRGRLGRGRAARRESRKNAMAQANVGRVVQVIGPVVDVEFRGPAARRSTTPSASRTTAPAAA